MEVVCGFDLAYTVISQAIMGLWNACHTRETYREIGEQRKETVEI